jgi:hypothetical protein
MVSTCSFAYHKTVTSGKTVTRLLLLLILYFSIILCADIYSNLILELNFNAFNLSHLRENGALKIGIVECFSGPLQMKSGKPAALYGGHGQMNTISGGSNYLVLGENLLPYIQGLDNRQDAFKPITSLMR